ncbi:MAG: hypothetical protein LBR20_03965, partial [Propionibacteriaceae bacterium]|nr:hypothetical protein [Propionibacteriaceae bacterium]
MSQVEVAVADVTTAPGEVQPGTRILPDYGAGYCSNGTTYPGGSKAQKAACEAAGGSWTYSLLTANANTFERTYAMKNGATNYVAHDFTYGIKASNSTALITSVSGATQSGDSVSGTYYEPVWQGWTGCADGNNIYTTACADGSAPRFYYRGSFMSGLFTLPRYDGMIYGFAGAEQSNENWQMSINSTIDFHDTEIGSNSQVQPLAINVKKGANYTPASDVLGPSTKVSTKAGIEDVSTSEVDKSITVKITPDASYTTLTSRYSTAFYTQDWMYWGSEARDASNASAIKWTSGSGVLYDELTAPNGSYTGTDRFDPSSSYQAMNYIPTWITARYRADSIYYSPQHTANQNGVPNSMEGVDGRYQGGADPLTNPNNPTFSAAQLQMTSFTGTNYDRATGFAIAALYGTASDNDGMIWLGGLGSAGSPINTATNQDGTQTLNQSCANTYYVADDVKLRFAYPAGKEQEPVEHYYYPIAVNSSTGEPIYSNGRNDGSGVYDLNCGMGLYAKNDYSQPHSLDQFSLDVDPLGADNFSGFFRGAASFTGLSGRRWNQPFVRTRNAATP